MRGTISRTPVQMIALLDALKVLLSLVVKSEIETSTLSLRLGLLACLLAFSTLELPIYTFS